VYITLTDYIRGSEETLARVISRRLACYIKACVEAHQACHMVFPGGRSPRLVFEMLAEEDLPWTRLHLYPSDERCVCLGSVERNDKLIDVLLVDAGLLPEKNLHRIPAECGAKEGARLYHEYLLCVPRFDIALLGVGGDGHIASLFAGMMSNHAGHLAWPVHDSPKPPKERVTISLPRLREARERWVLAFGAEKKEIVARIQRGEDSPVVRVLPTMLFTEREVRV
jgi:6-phosphogluconolactonase